MKPVSPFRELDFIDKHVKNLRDQIKLLEKRDSIMVEALSEIKATDEGTSSQPIKVIVEGCILELNDVNEEHLTHLIFK